jgi:nitroimidazol reductase NimA-like FMN-containing flavoprotein (pyridoxamine 5'-phosphate oxidase superfamily)
MLGELNNDQVEDVLRGEVVGRIGCSVDGRTYVVPIMYAYDGRNVYGHSDDGMKLQMMRANPAVCFEVDHMDGLSSWRSVIAHGTFEELDGAAADAALELFIDRLLPPTESETSTATLDTVEGVAVHLKDIGAARPVVYCIRLAEKTGRFETR